MPLFPVSETKEKELLRRMKALGIEEGDLVEEFIRGSGPGGQKINKTSVAVALTHLPTKTRVRCQVGRSQAMNRYYARKQLVEKIEVQVLRKKSERQKKIEKIRRQKRRRSRRAKEKMLAEKKKTGELKRLRRSPNPHEE
jgi:protein subunit release factor B